MTHSGMAAVGQWGLGWSERMCMCMRAFGVGGGVGVHANRVLFASPERPREARSYLARASAAVSHNLHAPLPGGG